MAKADTQTVVKLLREYAHRAARRQSVPGEGLLPGDGQPLGLCRSRGSSNGNPRHRGRLRISSPNCPAPAPHPNLEKLRKEIPAGVLEMLVMPGIRPDKALRLYKDLGITSLAELEDAAKDDRIRKAKGLGTATANSRSLFSQMRSSDVGPAKS